MWLSSLEPPTNSFRGEDIDGGHVAEIDATETAADENKASIVGEVEDDNMDIDEAPGKTRSRALSNKKKQKTKIFSFVKNYE
jgi:hypothetical protein